MELEVHADGTVTTVPDAHWVTADRVKACQIEECRANFGLLKRKMRCNACGRVCCSSCVNQKVALPPRHTSPIGVCMHCYLKVTAGPPAEPRSSESASPSRSLAPTAEPAGETNPSSGDLYADANASPKAPVHTDTPFAQESTTAALEQVRNEVAELESKSALLRQENESLQTQVTAQEVRIKDAEAAQVAAEERADKLAAEASAAPPEAGSQPAAEPSATDGPAASPMSVQILAMQTEQLREDEARLHEEQEKHEKKVAADLARVQAQEEQLAQRRKQLAADQAAHKEAKAQLGDTTKATERLNARVAELEEALDSAKASATTLEEQLQQARAETTAARDGSARAAAAASPQQSAADQAQAEFLRTKEAQLSQQQQDLIKRQGEAAQKEKQLKAAEEKLRAMRERTQRTEDDLTARESALTAKEEAVAEREATLSDREAESGRAIAAARQEREVAELAARNAKDSAAALAEREAAIVNREAALTQREQSADARDQELATQRQTLTERQQKVDEQAAALHAASTEERSLEQRVAELAARVASVFDETADAMSRAAKADLAAAAKVEAKNVEDKSDLDRKLAALEQERNALESESAKVTADRKAFEAARLEREAASANEDRLLDERRQTLTQREDSLAGREETAQRMTRAVADRESELKDREAAIARKETEATATMEQAEKLLAEAAAKQMVDPAAAAELKAAQERVVESEARLNTREQELKAQDAELADGARRAEAALKEKAEQLRAAQAQVDQAASRAIASETSAQELTESVAARERDLEARERAVEDESHRVVELRKEVREKLAAITAESHKLSALRKEAAANGSGTPRTPVFAGPAVGRFMAAQASVFRPLDPPKTIAAAARSPRTPRQDATPTPSAAAGGGTTPRKPHVSVPVLPFRFGEWDADLLAHVRQSASAADQSTSSEAQQQQGHDDVAAATTFGAAPLLAVGTAATQLLGLHDIVVPAATWTAYLAALEHHYNPNPYHNSVHAADVVHNACALVMMFPDLMEALSPVEKFALVFAAAIHDVGHPGLTNAFLNRTLDPVAIAANFRSSGEYGHLSLAFGLVQQPKLDVTTLLTEGDLMVFTSLVSELVFTTDMATHSRMMLEAEDELGRGLNLESHAHRRLLLRLVLHAADIGNPAKPQAVFKEWEQRINTEHDMQAAREADLGMSPSPGLAPNPSFAATSVAPLFGLLRRYWPEAALQAALVNLMDNCADAAVDMRRSLPELEHALEDNEATAARLADELEEARRQLEEAAARVERAEAVAAASGVMRAQELDAAIAAKEAKLAELDSLETRLVESEATMQGMMREIIGARAAAMGAGEDRGAADGNTDDVSPRSRAVLVDASAVIAERERVAREQMADASRRGAAAERTIAEARELVAEVEVRETESRRRAAEAEEVLSREKRVASAAQWVDSVSANAFSTAAKTEAIAEAEGRLQIAAEQLDGVFRIARDRIERLAELQTRYTTASTIAAGSAEREQLVAKAIEESRDRRRRVAQARVLHNRSDPEPWLQLERQIYSFTDVLGAMTNDKQEAPVPA